MTLALRASTEAGARLCALADVLADDLATRAAAHDRAATFPHASSDALHVGRAGCRRRALGKAQREQLAALRQDGLAALNPLDRKRTRRNSSHRSELYGVI